MGGWRCSGEAGFVRIPQACAGVMSACVCTVLAAQLPRASEAIVEECSGTLGTVLEGSVTTRRRCGDLRGRMGGGGGGGRRLAAGC